MGTIHGKAASLTWEISQRKTYKINEKLSNKSKIPENSCLKDYKRSAAWEKVRMKTIGTLTIGEEVKINILF